MEERLRPTQCSLSLFVRTYYRRSGEGRGERRGVSSKFIMHGELKVSATNEICPRAPVPEFSVLA